jgi:protein O-mannosyl-transferase
MSSRRGTDHRLSWSVKLVRPYVALLAAVLAAYSNHFQNGFHLGDHQTIVENTAIEHLTNIPRFFSDPKTFGDVPDGPVWRPLTSTTLAIDYWLGGGLKPSWFHLSTFAWFLVQIVLMIFLFRRIMDLADPHPSNRWTALAAAAIYGFHPAGAETVNYIIQRADMYNTLGVVASLLWFIAYPEQRRRGWYLLPAAAACLFKTPALVFPLILLAYLFLFEQKADSKQWNASLRAAAPALVVAAVLAYITMWMTSGYEPGAGLGVDAGLYRLTQPWVAAHYFRSFFLPTSLAVDQNWPLVNSAFSLQALAGDAFVIGMLAIAVYTARRRETRPIAFGLIWFFLALLPTALFPLSDPAPDRRMFFAFVGLALALIWTLRLSFQWLAGTASSTDHRPLWSVIFSLLAIILTAEAAAAHTRNEVWRTDETLWKDAILKHPDNPRGLLNYGLALMGRGDYADAAPYLERASASMQNNYVYTQLGKTYAALGRDEQADQAFQRVITGAPDEDGLCFAYGRWLRAKGRLPQARWCLERGIKLSPATLHPEARELLMQIYAEQQDWKSLDALVEYMLHVMPGNQVARRFAAERMSRQQTPAAQQEVEPVRSPEDLLNRSAEFCKAGKYQQCLDATDQILRVRPQWAEAWGNRSVALLAMRRWDEGINAARQALVIKPDYVAARQNLEWALKHRNAK